MRGVTFMRPRPTRFGTVKRCVVREVLRKGGTIMAICQEPGVSEVGYACFFKPGQVAPMAKESGTLTFTPGGATGQGFWRYDPIRN